MTSANMARRFDAAMSGGDAPARRLGRAVAATLALVALAVGVGAATANQPVLAISATLAGLAGAVLAIRPDAAAILVVALIYSNAPVVMVTFHDMPVAIAAAVPAILAAPLAYDLLVRRDKVIIAPAVPWIALYFVVEIVATLLARDVPGAADTLETIAVEGVGLFLLLTNAIRSISILRAIIWTLLIVGAILGTLSVYQYVTGTFGSNYFGFAQTESSVTGLTSTGVERLAGPIGEKNRYAQIMLMLVPIGFMTFTVERRVWLRLAALGATALCAMAMALTFSRGAAVAAVVVAATMVVLRIIRIRYVLAGLAIAAVVFVAIPEYGTRVLTLASVSDILSDEGVGSNADNSLLSRATENLTAINVFADHPIVGVGPGQFSDYYREYADEIGLSVRAQDREAHSLYLGLAAEAGVLGAGAFFIAVAVTLGALERARRAARHRPELAVVASGFLLALIAYLASGLFLHLSYARYFWLMLALGAVAAGLVQKALAESGSAASSGGTRGRGAEAALPNARPYAAPEPT